MKWFELLFKYPQDWFSHGALEFRDNTASIGLLLLGIVVMTVWVWCLYQKVSRKVRPLTHSLMIALRVAFLAVLLFMLAIPTLKAARQRGGSVFTAVMLDTSRSMTINDVDVSGQKKTRFDVARNLLGDTGDTQGVIGKLSDHSRVAVYGFDRDARRLDELKGVKPDGTATNIFKSFKDVEADLRGVPSSAVVLFTDGASTTGGNLDEAAALIKNWGVPVYVVGLGNPNPPRDYEVVQVLAPRKVRRNSEVEIYANVRSTGFFEPFKVQVFRGEEALASATVTPTEGTDFQRVKLKFTPDHEGSAVYRVSIPPGRDEAVVKNNSREFTLEIQEDRLPVLYVEGSPRQEYRFLRRAMLRDKDFRIVGQLRLDNKGRFYVQGSSDKEKYLEKHFPQTAEELSAFQAVILGDIESTFFTPAQLALLEEFVSKNGGGLLMLGGVNSFGLGKYAGTPVGKMLPLDISPPDGQPYPPYSDQTYSAQVTDDGLKHPVMQLLTDPVSNKNIWNSMPPLIGITPTRGLKGVGTLLLKQEKTNLPVLAVQNYGAGRVAAFTSGGSWYWQMSRPASEDFHAKFWKQLIRWLVVGAKEQLTVGLNADLYARKDPVIIRATVLAKDLKPVNDANVAVTITDPLNNKSELPMELILVQDGMPVEGVYECIYTPEEEGNYGVTVAVQPSDGADKKITEKKTVQTEFRVGEPVEEFNNAGLKEDALRALARGTGGKYYSATEASKLPEDVAQAIEASKYAGMQEARHQVWDMPILLGLLLALAVSEWILRRRSGLA